MNDGRVENDFGNDRVLHHRTAIIMILYSLYESIAHRTGGYDLMLRYRYILYRGKKKPHVL